MKNKFQLLNTGLVLAIIGTIIGFLFAGNIGAVAVGGGILVVASILFDRKDQKDRGLALRRAPYSPVDATAEGAFTVSSDNSVPNIDSSESIGKKIMQRAARTLLEAQASRNQKIPTPGA